MSGRLFALGPDGVPGEPEAPPESTEAAPHGPLRRVVLLVAYDGTLFHGFAAQRQPEVETVAGALARALGRVVGGEVALTCAGRTDKGVHASGQVVHADLPAEAVEGLVARSGGPELVGLARSLTAQCGPGIVVARALVAPPGFDARHSACARRYRYDLLRSAAPDPLARLTTWHVPGELDLAAMRIATDGLLGEHDFSAFCRRPPGAEGPLTRRVVDASWSPREDGRLLSFEIEANAFCHQMVRSIVGNLVEVGQGRRTAADVVALLRSRSRAGSAAPAPPGGLRLVLVRYPEELVEGGVLSC